MKKRVGKTNYTVSAGASRAGSVFHEVRLPDGDKVRIMDRHVFEEALAHASKKFGGTRVGRNPATGELMAKGGTKTRAAAVGRNALGGGAVKGTDRSYVSRGLTGLVKPKG